MAEELLYKSSPDKTVRAWNEALWRRWRFENYLIGCVGRADCERGKK